MLDRDALVRELIDAIRDAGYEGPIEHDPQQDRLVVKDRGEIGVAALMTDLARAEPDRRAAMLAKVVKVVLEPPMLPEGWGEAREQVLPIAHPRIAQVLDELRRQASGRSYRVHLAPITEHLLFKLGVPVDGGTLDVPAEVLERWGVEPEVAFQQAGQNLLRRSKGNWLRSEEADGVFASPWDDGQALSRLFVPALFGTLPLEGRAVVIAPSPSRFLVAGDANEEALFQMALLARRTIDRNNMHHVLRTVRMGADGETWEDWLPPEGHAAREPLKLLRAIEEKTDYTRQAATLREIARGQGPDTEVVPMPELEIQQSTLGAHVRTVTKWEEGTPQALPRADVVVLVRGGEALGAAKWDALVQAFPEAFQAAPGYPTRVLARAFPEDWQLAGLELEPWGG